MGVLTAGLVFVWRLRSVTRGLEASLQRHGGQIDHRLGKLEARLQKSSERMETLAAAMESCLQRISEQGEHRANALEARLQESSERMKTRVAAVESGLDRMSEEVEHRASALEACLRESDQRMETHATDASEMAMASGEIRGLVESVERLACQDSAAVLRSMASDVAVIKNTVKPDEAGLPAEAALEGRMTEELVSIAASVVFVRPLVPYPKWRFDADWANPDAIFQLRQRLWQRFQESRLETPVIINWHYGLKLPLRLGNDVSRQIFVGGAIDPNEFAFLDRVLEEGMTFVDVGANEGIYTLFAAKRVGPRGEVWAFEPSCRELERLQANINLNGLSVRVLPSALAEFSGEAEFTIAEDEHAGQNTLGAFAYEAVRALRKEKVEVVRLDDVVARLQPMRIDVIKLDIEGAEHKAIQGGLQTLGRFQPILLFEASEASLKHQGSGRRDVRMLLETNGYDLYRFDAASGLPVPADGKWSENMIATPNTKPLPERVRQFWPACK
jgi:FkbM family methyltransferase